MHKFIDFETDMGGEPFDESPAACQRNTDLMNFALTYNATNNTLRVPSKTFHFFNGIVGGRLRGKEVASESALRNSVLIFDGKLMFHRKPGEDAFKDNLDRHNKPRPCISLLYVRNVTLTSSSREKNKEGQGVIDGGGSSWWGFPYVGYLRIGEQRPILVKVHNAKNFTMENMVLKDAPFYSFHGSALDGVTIRHSSVVSRRTKQDGHSLIDLSAFNTDGIDVAGHNVHVHDVDIWTQDDCIAVKDNRPDGEPHVSSNMTFERINASGLGLSIGSIGGSTVRNITFRDCHLYRSVKGIYVKLRQTGQKVPGLVEDIVFENIIIDRPEQYGVWIGPAQQVGRGQKWICSTTDCSLCWPFVPGSTCTSMEYNTIRNITLRNVVIADPKLAAGVIMGHQENPIEGLTFENVIVTKGKMPKVDRMELFPGLAQPVNDKYVTTNVALLFAFIVAIGIHLCVSGYFMCKRTNQWVKYLPPRWAGSDEDQGTVPVGLLAKVKIYLIRGVFYFVVLLSLAVYVMLWWILCNVFLVLIGDSYTCEGVTGATVVGYTSPIPSCFAENNNPSKLKNNNGLIIVAVLVCLIHCLIAVVYWRSKVLQDETDTEVDSRPRCSTEDVKKQE